MTFAEAKWTEFMALSAKLMRQEEAAILADIRRPLGAKYTPPDPPEPVECDECGHVLTDRNWRRVFRGAE